MASSRQPQATHVTGARRPSRTAVGRKLGVGRMDHVGTSRTGMRLKGKDDTSSPG